MKVKITGADEVNWYRNKIGAIYDVKESPFGICGMEYHFLINDPDKSIERKHFEIIEETSAFDPVNKPEHYHKAGIDPITVMKHTFTKEEYAGFCKGNVLKYTMRYKEKGGTEDIDKAIFYLNELKFWEGE